MVTLCFTLKLQTILVFDMFNTGKDKQKSEQVNKGKFLDKLLSRKQESQIEEVNSNTSNNELENYYSEYSIHFYKLDADAWYSVRKRVFSF